MNLICCSLAGASDGAVQRGRRSRARRTKQCEEQAPLVESYLSSNRSTIYHVQEAEHEEVKVVADNQAPRSAKKGKASTSSTPQTGSGKKERKGKHKGQACCCCLQTDQETDRETGRLQQHAWSSLSVCWSTVQHVSVWLSSVSYRDGNETIQLKSSGFQ
ncbi:unnamed protein product [Oncorhynchus mykiss]|uniref:Tubby N-terminal domain-containing protein n=1 Tax=Oncorhynchus mykiss TaxID=8022 RepID=A0A060X3A8_ONCMY|nr:unnamed protein product [Oncorhynchus mykiss]